MTARHMTLYRRYTIRDTQSSKSKNTKLSRTQSLIRLFKITRVSWSHECTTNIYGSLEVLPGSANVVIHISKGKDFILKNPIPLK